MNSAMTKSSSPWIWLILLVTLILTWYTMQDDDISETVQARNIALSSRVKSEATSLTPSLQLQARKSFKSGTDIFSDEKPVRIINNNNPKPAQKIIPILAPLPFKYIGRWKDDAGLQVLLEAHGEVLTVKSGDVLLSRYQVQSIQETAFNIVIEFLTMPENQKQILQVGKAKDE